MGREAAKRLAAVAAAEFGCWGRGSSPAVAEGAKD